jgi:hypothetical protein
MQGGKLCLEPATLTVHKSAKPIMDSIITSYIFVRPKVNTAKMNVEDGIAAGMATGFSLNIPSTWEAEKGIFLDRTLHERFNRCYSGTYFIYTSVSMYNSV